MSQDNLVNNQNTKTGEEMPAKEPSTPVKKFLEEYPEIQHYVQEQKQKGDLPGEFTPTVVEIRFEGLTYVRYESGEITASRECREGYIPPFWEICFDENESALFVLSPSEIILDRTSEMTELDEILEQCNFRAFADA